MSQELKEVLGILVASFTMLVVVSALAFGVLLLLPTWQGRGGGEHVAYITSVEEVGTIWITSRIYTKTDTGASNEDTFCVQDKLMIDAAKEAAQTREPVTIVYKDQGLVWGWECGGEPSTVIEIRE